MRRQVARVRRGRGRLSFIGEVTSELKKVVWPTRQEAIHLTTIVIVVSIAVGIILGIVDFVFSRLMQLLLG
jgi:preprotein translocase subunit SecE